MLWPHGSAAVKVLEKVDVQVGKLGVVGPLSVVPGVIVWQSVKVGTWIERPVENFHKQYSLMLEHSVKFVLEQRYR